jgi:hypothetical protein
VVPEAKAATFEWEVGEEEGKLGEWDVSVRNVLKKEVAGGLEGFREGGRPRVKDRVRRKVGVVEDVSG